MAYPDYMKESIELVRKTRLERVEIDKKGTISISRRAMNIGMFKGIMRKTLSINGRMIPICIRADARTQHQYVSQVMDACKELGFYKVKFVALKSEGKKKKSQG